MAEVTKTRSTRFTVAGNRRRQIYQITGVTGDTLTTGLRNVEIVTFEPSTITAYTTAGGVITLTASGAFTAIDVEVVGT
jgi:hypothetical protein